MTKKVKYWFKDGSFELRQDVNGLYDKIARIYWSEYEVTQVHQDDEFGAVWASIEGLGENVGCGWIEDYI